MKSKPILFSGPMVRALLAGTKVQTRRLVKPQPSAGFNWCRVNRVGPWFHIEADKPQCVMHTVTCKLGEPGTRLIVKEDAWMWCEKVPNGTTEKGRPKFRYVPMREAPIYYCADHPAKPTTAIVSEHRGYEWLWRKKIGRFLPWWASRITLEITAVRVERLNDISEENAKAEGIERIQVPPHEAWKNYEFETAHPRKGATITYQKHRLLGYKSPIEAYASLWESLNGAGSWAANPYVWVVEFKRV